MREGTTRSATVTIRATPEEVYDTVSDVTRIPEWSPECVSVRWVAGADGPAVGATFVGWNRRGPVRWRTKPRVEVAERPRRFGFIMGHPPYGDLTRWTYDIAPGDEPGTTEVTESFEMVRDLPRPLVLFERWALRVPDRARDLQRNLEMSLQRLRRVVERQGSRSS